MRSFAAMSLVVLFMLGCDAGEPAADDPASTRGPSPNEGVAPSPAVPAPSEGVTPAPVAGPTPPAPVIAAPVMPAPPSAPTPVDVCRHVRGVASEDQAAANLLDEVERDCTVALERVRKQYDTLSSCLLNTSTAADVAACEHSMRNWKDLLAKADPKPTGAEVCAHVMDIMRREFGDGAALPSDEDKAKFEENCVQDLEKQKAKVGAERFDAQAVCVMEATKMEELMKCQKDENDRAE